MAAASHSSTGFTRPVPCALKCVPGFSTPSRRSRRRVESDVRKRSATLRVVNVKSGMVGIAGGTYLVALALNRMGASWPAQPPFGGVRMYRELQGSPGMSTHQDG